MSDRPSLLSVAVAQVSGINTKNINTVEASERKTKCRLHSKLPKWASKINSGHWSDFPKIVFLASFFEDFIVFVVFPATISKHSLFKTDGYKKSLIKNHGLSGRLVICLFVRINISISLFSLSVSLFSICLPPHMHYLFEEINIIADSAFL